jgi:hypothetical protein
MLDPSDCRIPHGVEQAFMLDPSDCRIPHGVEQAFMPALLLLDETGFSR